MRPGCRAAASLRYARTYQVPLTALPCAGSGMSAIHRAHPGGPFRHALAAANGGPKIKGKDHNKAKRGAPGLPMAYALSVCAE